MAAPNPGPLAEQLRRIAELHARIDAALALHVRFPTDDTGDRCACGAPWPCITRQVLEGDA